MTATCTDNWGRGYIDDCEFPMATFLTLNKEYPVHQKVDGEVQITDDTGVLAWFDVERFEIMEG